MQRGIALGDDQHSTARDGGQGTRRRYGSLLVLALIVTVGAALRWYGLAWDAGYLFHPDERQIVMVASNLGWPGSLLDFLSASSPLNPHFFAYGSLPIYLLRALAPLAPPSNLTGPWANDFLARWVIFGRSLSGLFDLGCIVLVFLLGRQLYRASAGLLAAAMVALTVLHIQLAHFYAVDTLLTFFVMATLYAAARLGKYHAEKPPGRDLWLAACGLLLGLALATKASAAPLIVPITFALWHRSGATLPTGRYRDRLCEFWRVVRRPLGQVVGIALVVFVVTQPYIVLDGVSFVRAVVQEGLLARGWLDFPYTRQYANTLPFVYQVTQSAIWGMGLPLGIVAWGGGFLFAVQALRRRDWPGLFLLSWGLVYFVLIGGQYVKYPRYLLPLLPVLMLMAAQAVLSLKLPRLAVSAVLAVLLGVTCLYAVAFVSMYGREHPWLVASRWIYEHAAPGATVVVEQWDDALPVLYKFENGTRTGSEYPALTMPIQDADGEAKLEKMASELARADIVILSSQRAYASLARQPGRYPLTARYYQLLFDGGLGYELQAAPRNDPELIGWRILDDPRAGLPFATPPILVGEDKQGWDWGFEDESLTVYDHPQPLIFVKTRVMSEEEIMQALRGPARLSSAAR